MKFRYAAELKKEFQVQGHFYDLQLKKIALSCRSSLEIRKKRCRVESELPDAVIMMMNPGSSRPMDSGYIPSVYSLNTYKKISIKQFIETQPDSTQYQIMRLMKVLKWDFVRILNLSDLRNGNSSEFQKQLREVAIHNPDHPDSLLSKHRAKELQRELNSKNDLVIGAWGSIPELSDLAIQFLVLRPKTLMLSNGQYPNCRHASPMMKTHKIEWLKSMKKMVQAST